ncbi:MAG: 5-formyltetrahydrofolate cyclo-ligase [Aquisalimonadaceae bacterium]
MIASKGDIRRDIRARRRSLTSREQKRASRQLAAVLNRWKPWRRARHVALYLPNDGEPDLTPLARAAWRDGKQVYLPVLAGRGGNHLWFRRYTPGSRLIRNRFDIPEPSAAGTRISPRQLDLVLAPLVAFDARGHRLGMGGGFYDRTFGFVHHRPAWQHPRLVGVAHHFQQLDELPAEPWDVPLTAIATDRGLIRPRA